MGAFDVSYAGALGAGVLSFLSPCVLPLVPPYLCFIGGVSLDQMTEGADAKTASPSNVYRIPRGEKGDVEKGFAEADIVLEREFSFYKV